MLKVKCCKEGSYAIKYMQKRKEYCLSYETEDWWTIICYCPWCGKQLDTSVVDYDTTLEMDKL